MIKLVVITAYEGNNAFFGMLSTITYEKTL